MIELESRIQNQHLDVNWPLSSSMIHAAPIYVTPWLLNKTLWCVSGVCCVLCVSSMQSRSTYVQRTMNQYAHTDGCEILVFLGGKHPILSDAGSILFRCRKSSPVQGQGSTSLDSQGWISQFYPWNDRHSGPAGKYFLKYVWFTGQNIKGTDGGMFQVWIIPPVFDDCGEYRFFRYFFRWLLRLWHNESYMYI